MKDLILLGLIGVGGWFVWRRFMPSASSRSPLQSGFFDDPMVRDGCVECGFDASDPATATADENPPITQGDLTALVNLDKFQGAVWGRDNVNTGGTNDSGAAPTPEVKIDSRGTTSMAGGF
jgi:hypothetical protein